MAAHCVNSKLRSIACVQQDTCSSATAIASSLPCLYQLYIILLVKLAFILKLQISLIGEKKTIFCQSQTSASKADLGKLRSVDQICPLGSVIWPVIRYVKD